MVTKSVGESIEIDPRLKQLGEQKVAEWRKWFDSRLDDAIEAAATQENPQLEGNWSFKDITVEREMRPKYTEVNANERCKFSHFQMNNFQNLENVFIILE